MSGRLVGEVAEWLRTPAAAELTLGERTVLLIIAERVNERDEERKMLRHRTDDVTLFERLCEVTGIDRAGMTEVLKKLAGRELEVRIEIRKTKAGNPVFAHRGHAMEFWLPPLPASAALPERVGDDGPFTPDEPVDNPADEEPEDDPGAPERVGEDRPNDPNGSAGTDAFAGKGRSQPIPKSFYGDPSNCNPSTPVDPSSVVTVEDGPPAAATPPAGTKIDSALGWDPNYQDAVITLTRFPDFGEQFIARAKTELGDDTDRQQLYIRAAQLASQGIPA